MRSHQYGANCVWVVEVLETKTKKGRYTVRTWVPCSAQTSRSRAREVERWYRDTDHAKAPPKYRVRRYMDSGYRWERG